LERGRTTLRPTPSGADSDQDVVGGAGAPEVTIKISR
jgi:hypothetical protein